MKRFTSIGKLCAFLTGLIIVSPSFAQSVTDLGVLSKDGGSVKYMAVGSTLSAGVRDGGLYAEAQQTSFPALLAKQMGITNFKQPLLEGNGTGKLSVELDKNGIIKRSDEKRYDDTAPFANLPKVNGNVDNMSIPYQKVGDLYSKGERQVNQFYDNRSFRHLNRFHSGEETSSLAERISANAKNYNFFSFEFGMQDFVNYVSKGGYGLNVSDMNEREFTAEYVLLQDILKRIDKGVIVNVPNLLIFPIFKKYKTRDFSNKFGEKPMYIEHWLKADVRPITEEIYAYPHF